MKSLIKPLFIASIVCIIALSGSAIAQETASSTGHDYEFVDSNNITYEEAREAASERTHDGKQGYLVTITSEEEQEFVQSQFDQQAWIGASDVAEEGTWRWVTGPEGEEDNGQGRHFFTQSGDGGSTVNGNYANWKSSTEPNNAGGIEHHALMKSDGTWNDINKTATLDGYVVEYGGLEDSEDGTDSGDSEDSTDSVSDQVEPSISFEPSPPRAGEQVAFSGTDSTAENGEIISYNWKFGDGETASGATVSHTYNEPGGYNVELTVITDQGNSYSTTEPISVEEGESEGSDGGSISVETPGFGFGSTIMSFAGLAYIIRRKLDIV